MFHKSINNLDLIKKEIQSRISELNYQNYNPKIIAVCKTFPISEILPLINHGHLHFGENKVQEALEKWTDLKINFKNIKLHMVGKLQTNKVKFILPLFIVAFLTCLVGQSLRHLAIFALKDRWCARIIVLPNEKFNGFEAHFG